MTIANKPIVDPTLTDVLQQGQQDFSMSLNCVKIGQIKSFDGTKRTARAQILIDRVLADGTTKPYPLLLDCPVFTLQGGGGGIQFPITVGDDCIVLFCDRDLDAWYLSGNEGPPLTSRLHHLSDGIILVGLNSLVSPMQPYVDGQVSLFNGVGAEIDLTAQIVTIKNSTTTLLTVLNDLITAIEAIQVVGDLALTAPSIAALEAIRVELATLLL